MDIQQFGWRNSLGFPRVLRCRRDRQWGRGEMEERGQTAERGPVQRHPAVRRGPPKLARELCQSCATVQGLQNTLQQVLDQREEARQSKQLLELYLRALEKEGDILSNQEESKAALSEDLDAVDTGISKEMASDVALTSRILTTLREKPSPELSLSSQDLELVSKEDPKALAVALNWDIKKAETVQQACNTELTLRLQQMQSLRSLRNFSARKNPLPGEQQSPKRAKQDPE
ncbi:DNA fragmentation factor subunit alpha-like [Cricetulus griseus]|uniref:DNA fragmentation factor subunit alpha-like n=1 Tax=Cricetulus griseus TaxID=10029 RepID=UPI0015C357EE|nr:DNA fragmentation factor subunit alpha-like [Cricetulus griseus]